MRSRHPFIAWGAMALLTLSIVAQPAGVARAQPGPAAGGNAVAEVEKSIIQLGQKWTGEVQYPTEAALEWSGEIEAWSGCSGFFVTNTGHAVTAGHCVELSGGRRSLIEAFLNQKVEEGALTQAEAQEIYPTAVANWKVEGADGQSPPQLTVYARQPYDVEGAVLERVVMVQVVDVRPSDQGDVALLKIEAEDTPALAVAATDPPNNTAITSIGFAGATSAVVDQDLQRADFKSGTVSARQTSRTGVPIIGVNADVSSGMSGGPTVDQQGNVLGVNSFGVVDESGVSEPGANFITDTTDLRDYLSSRNLAIASARTPASETVPQTAPAPAPESSFPWLWFALAGVVLVAGAGILLLVSRNRGRKGGRPAPIGAPDDGHNPWDQGGGWPPPGPGSSYGQPTTPQYGPSGSAGRRCSSCGTPAPAGSAYCGSCGRQV